MPVVQRLAEYRVFLSSPGDVADERGLARRIVQELSAEPFLRGRARVSTVSWDDPAAPTPMLANLTPQAALERGLPKPSECDFVVVILWSRMGTPLPMGTMQDRGSRSGRRCGELVVVVRGPEAVMATAEGELERVVQHRRAHVEEGGPQGNCRQGGGRRRV